MSNKALSITAWIEVLRGEVLEMDKNAQYQQAQLWSKFGNNPEFDFLDDQLYEGWEDNRYLDWKTIVLSLNLKPVRTGFFSRIRSGLNWMFRSVPLVFDEKGVYQLCEKSDVRSFELKVVFTKTKGQINVNIER